MRRTSTFALFLCAASSLACGLFGAIEESAEDQVAGVLAVGLGVPPESVNVEADGTRFNIDAAGVSGDCGLGPSADVPEAFPFTNVADPIIDCELITQCATLFGADCGPIEKIDVDVVAVYQGGDVKAVEAARRAEMEGRGVVVTKVEERGTTMLIGRKGLRPAGAVVLADYRGHILEMLVSPQNGDDGGGGGGGGRKGTRKGTRTGRGTR